MSFQGSLDTVGLSDVFQLFAFSRKSGALHLRSDAGHGIVYFDDGEVYYATAAPTDGIGNLLVRAGLASPEQWKQVLSSAGDNGQGELLIRQDDVDAGSIEAFIEEHVEDAIFRLMQWEAGEFELEDETHPIGPVFKFACDPLLAEGERRLEIWRDICESIPSTSMGVRLHHDLPGDVAEISMTRDEWRLIAAISSGTSIVDLAASLGETEFRVVQALHELISRQLVELISEEKLAVLRNFVAEMPFEDPELEAAATSATLETDDTEVASAALHGLESAEEADATPTELDDDDAFESESALPSVDEQATPMAPEPAPEQADEDLDTATADAETTGAEPSTWLEPLEEPIPDGAAAYADPGADPGAEAPPETPHVSIADMAAQAEAEGTVVGAEYETEPEAEAADNAYAEPDAATQAGFYDQRATMVHQGADPAGGAEPPPLDPAGAPADHPAAVGESPDRVGDQYSEPGAAETDAPVAAGDEARDEDDDDLEGPRENPGDSNELDKSLILRLIAGVRSL